MRRFKLIAIVVALAIGAACSSDSEPDAAPPASSGDQKAAPNEVVAKQFLWAPESLTVKAGTVVTWKNLDDAKHTVQSGKLGATTPEYVGALDGKGSSFKHTFASVGSFDYFCTIHEHMVGKVIVQ